MGVRLAIMQPYIFPYIGYFQLMRATDRFVIYDDVTFIKQGWIARNRILINGEPSFFVVPVRHASSSVAIRETKIDDGPQHRQWVAKLLKTVDNAYRRAPHFARVFPLVESVFAAPATHVAELAVASLKAVAAYLDLDVQWVETSGLYGNAALSGEDRVLAICRAEGASEYVNPSGGRALYHRDRFAARGVRLSFLQPQAIEYRQFNGPFVPWLSIVDVLMFNDRETARAMLDRYDLE
jgi:hypothetical protein